MVSSTVPRLEDRCPPVAETECTMNARSSPASPGSCRRSRRRSSAGSLMDSRRGKLAIECTILAPAVDDEVRDLAQAFGAGTEALDGPERVAQQFLGETPRLGEPHERRVRGLAGCLVLARGLAERAGVAFLIEDVVDHLESEAHALGIAVEVRELLLGRRAAATRAHHDRRADERPGLEDVHELELGERNPLAH